MVLWGLAVGTPATGKSPGLDPVVSIIRAIEKDMRVRAEPELAEYEEKSIVASTYEKNWKRELASAIEKGEPEPRRPEKADPGQRPHMPQLLMMDTTIEAIADKSAYQPRQTLLVFRDEASGWLLSMERYSASSDRPFWLQANGGRSFPVDRKGAGRIDIPRLAVGVCGGIQPDKWYEMLHGDADDGLVQRFIIVWPEPILLERCDLEPNHQEMKNTLNRLYAMQMCKTEDDLKPFVVELTPSAQDLHYCFREWTRKEGRSEDGMLGRWLGKLDGLVLRIAGTIAALDAAELRQELDAEISESQLRRAIHFVQDYAYPMAKRAYGVAGMSDTARKALQVLTILREIGSTKFKPAEVYKRGVRGIDDSPSLKPVLAYLEEHHCIIRHESGKTGRKAVDYFVHPEVLKEK